MSKFHRLAKASLRKPVMNQMHAPVFRSKKTMQLERTLRFPFADVTVFEAELLNPVNYLGFLIENVHGSSSTMGLGLAFGFFFLILWFFYLKKIIWGMILWLVGGRFEKKKNAPSISDTKLFIFVNFYYFSQSFGIKYTLVINKRKMIFTTTKFLQMIYKMY